MGFYAYLWLREDGTPYYAGKGKDRRAYNSHARIHPPIDITRIVIFERKTEEAAFETEKELIRNWGRKDIGTGCLRNMTAGGEGVCDWSDELRKQAGARARGRPSFRKGKTLSATTRRCMSNAQKGNRKSLGHQNARGHRHTADELRRMSETHKGVPWSAARRLAEQQRKHQP